MRGDDNRYSRATYDGRNERDVIADVITGPLVTQPPLQHMTSPSFIVFARVCVAVGYRAYSVIALFYTSDEFLPRDAIILQFMPSSCVRPSVCPSQAGIVSKSINVESHKQRHAQNCSGTRFMRNVSAKFERGHPTRGCQMHVCCPSSCGPYNASNEYLLIDHVNRFCCIYCS